MGDFGDAERRILSFMVEGTEFNFENKKFVVEISGKPTCHKGEPKTDIYVLAKSASDKKEIKISYKKENADFIENKMSAERAEQLFGKKWAKIIEDSTTSIMDKFEERMLIYKNKFKRTEKGAITLGWKFELLNKSSGDLSGKMKLTEEQVIDVYAGSNLAEDKRNAMVNGKVIKDSGVANYNKRALRESRSALFDYTGISRNLQAPYPAYGTSSKYSSSGLPSIYHCQSPAGCSTAMRPVTPSFVITSTKLFPSVPVT